MKTTPFLKVHFLPCLLTLLLSECATILLSASAPDSPPILVNGEEVGTPTISTDTRLQDSAFIVLINETDSLAKDTVNRFLPQVGIGGGICFNGSLWGFNYTMISTNNWGASFRFYWNISKSENVPSDYYDDGARTFAPKDYVNTLSLNVLKAFPTRHITSRVSVEAGPALVIYRQAEFELNPSYTPDYPMPGSIYLYNKSHPRKFTAGVTLMAKYEYLPSQAAGFEFGLFTNINSFQTIVGLEVSIIFGRLR